MVSNRARCSFLRLGILKCVRVHGNVVAIGATSANENPKVERKKRKKLILCYACIMFSFVAVFRAVARGNAWPRAQPRPTTAQPVTVLATMVAKINPLASNPRKREHHRVCKPVLNRHTDII